MKKILPCALLACLLLSVVLLSYGRTLAPISGVSSDVNDETRRPADVSGAVESEIASSGAVRAPVTSESAEGRSAGERDSVVTFSGHVVDKDGPLTKGKLTIFKSREGARPKLIEVKLATSGFFTCDIARAEFPTLCARVVVDDEKSIAFDGLVQLAEGVSIPVVSSRTQERFVGRISVSGLSETAKWLPMLLAHGGAVELLAAATEEHSGNSANVEFIFADLQVLSRLTPAALVISSRDKDLRAAGCMGHVHFESAGGFVQALRSGITVERNRLVLTCAMVAGVSVERVLLTSTHTNNAYYVCSPEEGGAFTVSIPPGHYVVKGECGPVVAIDEVEAKKGRDSIHIQWKYAVPGPYDVNLVVCDETDQPVAGAPVAFETADDGGLRHRSRGTLRTDALGSLTIPGLIDAEYEFSTLWKGRYATVKASIVKEPSPVLRLGELCDLSLDIENVREIGLDALVRRDCQIWYSAYNEGWQLVHGSDWIIRRLTRRLPYRVAILGPWWGGSGAAVGGDGQVNVPVRLTRMKRIAVQVESASKRDLKGLTARAESTGIDGVERMPWSVTKVGLDRRFELPVPQGSLAAVRICIYDGTRRLVSVPAPVDAASERELVVVVD